MANLIKQHPHILFLFSDTGGGHRSATEAIIEALQLEYGDRLTTKMVDIFLEIAPRPLNYLPKWYPYMVRFPEVWGFSYHISNGTRRARLIVESAYPYVRRAVHKVVAQNPSFPPSLTDSPVIKPSNPPRATLSERVACS